MYWDERATPCSAPRAAPVKKKKKKKKKKVSHTHLSSSPSFITCIHRSNITIPPSVRCYEIVIQSLSSHIPQLHDSVFGKVTIEQLTQPLPQAAHCRRPQPNHNKHRPCIDGLTLLEQPHIQSYQLVAYILRLVY